SNLPPRSPRPTNWRVRRAADERYGDLAQGHGGTHAARGAALARPAGGHPLWYPALRYQQSRDLPPALPGILRPRGLYRLHGAALARCRRHHVRAQGMGEDAPDRRGAVLRAFPGAMALGQSWWWLGRRRHGAGDQPRAAVLEERQQGLGGL